MWVLHIIGLGFEVPDQSHVQVNCCVQTHFYKHLSPWEIVFLLLYETYLLMNTDLLRVNKASEFFHM